MTCHATYTLPHETKQQSQMLKGLEWMQDTPQAVTYLQARCFR